MRLSWATHHVWSQKQAGKERRAVVRVLFLHALSHTPSYATARRRSKLQLDVVARSHDEMSKLAVKAFELSQSLREKRLTADYAAKRRILEIILLNLTLVDSTLVNAIRKPFDVLVEGLVSKQSGAEGTRTLDI
jgi:hypothetical protein